MISVIIPVYNAEPYLRQCMESIQGQSRQDLQIICVNDGSTDGSLEILEQCRARDGRVEIVTTPNRGLSPTRNTGLERASGDYMMFVDSDDWLDKDTCAIAVSALEREQADMAFWSYAKEYRDSSSPVLFWEEDRVFEGRDMEWLANRILGPSGRELSQPERMDSMGTAWGKMYRRTLFQDPDTRFVGTDLIGSAEDVLSNLAVFRHVGKAVYISSLMYHYRKTSSSALTRKYKPALVEQWEELFRRMAEQVKKGGGSQESFQALRNREALSFLFLGLNICQSPGFFFRQYGLLRALLKRPWCRESMDSLVIRDMPLHWRCFFGSAKLGLVSLNYLLLLMIKRILAR